MNDPSPRVYKEILRLDLGYFAHHCFCELNPQAVFLPNWHIEVIAAKHRRDDRRRCQLLDPRRLDQDRVMELRRSTLMAVTSTGSHPGIANRFAILVRALGQRGINNGCFVANSADV